MIKTIFIRSKNTYGSPRILQELKKNGLCISKNTVAKLMKEMNLYARSLKKFKIVTTNSNHYYQTADRIFKIEKTLVSRCNQVWAGDITYLKLGDKFMYLSVVLDVYSRKIVGWSLTKNLSREGVIKSLKSALNQCKNSEGLIFHSDQGIQYSCDEFSSLLSNKKIIASMSRKGNCYDNAYVESFFKSLKSECIYRNKYSTVEELRSLIFNYIEVWYNRKRLHSSLGYLTPEEFENRRIAA